MREREPRGGLLYLGVPRCDAERAGIQDVRVRTLADEIIAAQRREIAEMEWLIADIERHGLATTEEEARGRPVPAFAASP